MNIYYYTIKGNENVFLDNETITVNGVDYYFQPTIKEGYDYKVNVSNATQLVLDRLNSSEIELLTTEEDYNNH